MDALAYLVPHDFTEVGDLAAHHAMQLARQTSGTVHLLHIVKNESEKATAKAKFEEIIKSYNLKPYDPKVTVYAVVGNIFEDIAKMAKQVKASVVIMGTHGVKGMQKVFGSFAIKVISSTEAPFIIVQEGARTDAKVKKIVFPIDLSAESIQIMNSAGNIALDYDAEIILIAQKESDAALRRKISIHLEVVKKQLTKRNVKFVVNFVEKSKQFHKVIIDYSKKENADMIAIAYYTESMLPQFDPFAQSIINNEAKIPVLVIQSKQVGAMYF